ncbi:hypothetical protein BH23ACT12_BH23ACT12_15200 [soil metagenome]
MSTKQAESVIEEIEDKADKLDRELAEFHQELRVALPGG